MTKFTMWKKNEKEKKKKKKKKDLTIISNPHAHPRTMKKTHAKFHYNEYKTVREVVTKTCNIILTPFGPTFIY